MRFMGQFLRLTLPLRSTCTGRCFAGLLVLGAAVFPAFAAKTTLDFISGKTIAVPANFILTYPALAADLTGNKRTDFVVGGEFSDPSTGVNTPAILSLLNEGDDKFKQVTALTDHGQSVMALADLNGDGKPDLVCTTIYTDPNPPYESTITVEISFGRGDGTFENTESYTLPGAHVMIEVGDINGDGKPDLALGTDTLVQTLLNIGDGKFKAGPSYSSSTPNGFTLGDVNGDGRSDLLIPQSSKLVIAYATTSGAFITSGSYPIRPYPQAPTVADINGDGHMDIAVPTSQGIDIFLGDSKGTFIPGAPVNCGPAASIALTPLRKSGTLDLIVTVWSPIDSTQASLHRLAVYPGNGNGTFATPRLYVSPQGASILGVFDINGDHNADVVLGDLTRFLGDGNGYLSGAPVTLAGDSGSILTGDFNRDGKPDVAVVHNPQCSAGVQCDAVVTVFPGTGKDWFNPGTSYSTGIPVAFGMAAGDVNGDGIIDLVVGGSTQISVLLGMGDGSFKAGESTDIGDYGSVEVFLADVNNDKKLDIVLDTGIMLGKGDGTFGPVIPYPDQTTDSRTTAVAVGDFNGDGKPDIAAAYEVFTGPYTSPTYNIKTLNGDGKGNFTVSSQWSFPSFIVQMVAAKMHPSPVPDLLVAYGGLSIYKNNGHGSFPHNLGTQYDTNSQMIVVDDFNGDGINDVASIGFGTLEILAGKGDGTLNAPPVPPYPYTYSAIVGSIAAGDFNLDGALDIVTASPLGISRYYNADIPVTNASTASASDSVSD